MTFAKCIGGGEPDRVFASPTAREMPASRLKMRQLLGWTRGGSNNSSKAPASPQSPAVRDAKGAGTPPPLSPAAVSVKLNASVAYDAMAAPATPRAAPPSSSSSTQQPTQQQYEDEVARDSYRVADNGNDDDNVDDDDGSDSSDDEQQQQKRKEKSRASSTEQEQHEGEEYEEDGEFAPPPPPSVVYRKGEKSFLDFHQHYAITRHLGEGSYSTVKQVTHRKKGGLFACKIVDKAALSAVDRAALSQEVLVLARLSHENIMRLHEVIEDDSKCYLVTELAEHGDLFDRIVKQGKFPPREAQQVVAALVEALHYCHARNIIHRDIKPENVLLSGDSVKLCDFGFAKQLGARGEQSVDSCGTPGYAAPEILDGKPYGLEVDVFSLGVVAYIMLCGYPPFPMKLSQLRTHRFHVRFPSKDWGHIDPAAKELIAQMLHITPAQRPSAASLRAHAWVREGKAALDRLRREADERRRLAALTRKQQAADAIRQKLAMGGFEVVKYGRNGLPHRTKLRLSRDGRELTWQPKLLKRGLLRYQNARSFTSLFGLAKEPNSSSQPQLHAHAHPQLERLSVCDGAVPARRAEQAHAPSPAAVSELSAGESTSASASTAASSARESTLESAGSNSSTASCASDASSSSEKKLWWKAFRRDRGKTERTASGGFALSLSLGGAARGSATSFDAGSSARTASASRASRLSAVAASAVAAAAAASGAKAPEKLDDAINLHDIRSLSPGDQSEFFAAHKLNLPNGCKRPVDPACVLSVATRFRELHLEFQNEETRDGFAYLLEQATLPSHKPAPTDRQRYASAVPRAPASPFGRGDRSASDALDNNCE